MVASEAVTEVVAAVDSVVATEVAVEASAVVSVVAIEVAVEASAVVAVVSEAVANDDNTTRGEEIKLKLINSNFHLLSPGVGVGVSKSFLKLGLRSGS